MDPKTGPALVEPANKMLDCLGTLTRERSAGTEPVILQAGMVLQEFGRPIEHVYFPIKGLVSLLCLQKTGEAIEVGLIGYEGMVGVPAILGGIAPYRAVVQMSGEGFRISSRRIVEEFRQNPRIQELLLRYTNTLLLQVAQQSVCNCYHSIQERVCRWLLLARDGTRSTTLHVTHDIIANLLGARRAGVTVAVGLLQRFGFIKIARGRITILDSEGLESNACECYTVVRDSMEQLGLNGEAQLSI